MMMFSFRAGPAQESEPRPKRAKIKIACNVCKSQKAKCDGARPVCGPCSRKKRHRNSQPCVYREVDAPSLASTPVRDMNRRHKGMRPVTIVSRDETPVNGTPERQRNTRTGENLNNPHQGHDESGGTAASGDGLFGASGGLYIFNGIGNERDRPTALEGRRESTSQALPRDLKQLPKLSKLEDGRETSDMQFAIPPRKVADNLLALYWDYVDSAYPWLDRSSIERAYESLWATDGEQNMNERALHCILNLMFATACVAFQGQTPLSRHQSSSVFFDRAQELMSYELMNLYNFEIIQILLLTTVYLQHQKQPQKSFRTIGMAIHIAQELGLHSPKTTEAMDDPHERDLACRVWNGCVIMDRICAMTFGCALKVPQPISKEGLGPLVLSTMGSINRAEDATLPSKMKFYASFCELHYIIGELLETFYIPNFKNDMAKSNSSQTLLFDKIAILFRIESDLNHWASNLHPFFRMPSEALDTTPSKHVTREANVLRARYLSVRLLLFRPLLSQINQQENSSLNSSPATSNTSSLYQDDQLLPHVVFQCQTSCTKAAGDMIEFISRNLPHQTQTYILPSNWYTVSYVYMAVTILLAARGSAKIVAHFSAPRLNGLLQQARSILEEYERDSTLASRCSSVLKLIEQNSERRGSVVEPAQMEETRHSSGPVNTFGRQDEATREQSQSFSDNIDMIENYTFDWNDWPVFFAELDGENSPIGGWELPT